MQIDASTLNRVTDAASQLERIAGIELKAEVECRDPSGADWA